MLSFIFVGSGSKGNATLIKSNDTIILIDDGLPKYRIEEGLKLFNAKLDDINDIFITHNHSDHIKGVSLLPKHIPLYASNKTFDPSINWQIVYFNNFDMSIPYIYVLQVVYPCATHQYLVRIFH